MAERHNSTRPGKSPRRESTETRLPEEPIEEQIALPPDDTAILDAGDTIRIPAGATREDLTDIQKSGKIVSNPPPSLEAEPSQSAQSAAILDRLETIEASQKLQQTTIDELRRIVDEQQRMIEQLRALLKKDNSPIRVDLPTEQRVILQAVLDLPGDAFPEAEQILGRLEGQPMTEAFCKSLRDVLRAKAWGIPCEVCKKPSGLVWSSGGRFAQGGVALFSHAGRTRHGSMTRIEAFKLVARPTIAKSRHSSQGE